MPEETMVRPGLADFAGALPEYLRESSVVTEAEMRLAGAWVEAVLAAAAAGRWPAAESLTDAASVGGWLGAGLPFSFRYGGEDMAGVLARMVLTVGPETTGESGDAQWDLAWADPAGGLRVTWHVRRTRAFPAVEWLVEFENTGSTDLAPLEEVRSLALRLAHGQFGQPAYLHGAYGGGCRANDMWPFVRTLGDPGSDPVVLGSPTVSATNGLPSSDYLPFCNLEMPEGRGLMIGLGSGGEWQASFASRSAQIEAWAGFRPRAFTLRPGQRLRGHRVLLVFWQGRPLHGHNLLRRLLYERYVPPIDGKPQVPWVTANVAFAYHGKGMFLEQATEENVLPLVEPFAAIGVEQVTIDAGWYETGAGSWPDGIGSWELASGKYPRGLRPVAARLNAAGMRLGVWFASEMVVGDKAVRREHPDWVETCNEWGDGLRMELPGAREWFLSKVDRLVREGGMQLYRQDGGSRRANVEHTTGLLAMFDAIRARHPGILMEGCCGGGRSIDLETLARFHWHQKSDRWGYTEEDQGGLYGANLYLPGGTIQVFTYGSDAYTMWSSFAGQLCVSHPDPLSPTYPRSEVAAHVALYKQVRHLLSGDFYPLTPCTFDAWIGYQFHRPDLDAGMALVFRRPDPASLLPGTARMIACLRGLDPSGRYEVTLHRGGPEIGGEGAGAAAACEMTGQVLAQEGLAVAIDQAPAAVLVTYRRV